MNDHSFFCSVKSFLRRKDTFLGATSDRRKDHFEPETGQKDVPFTDPDEVRN